MTVMPRLVYTHAKLETLVDLLIVVTHSVLPPNTH
jgi:hypothetical protein